MKERAELRRTRDALWNATQIGEWRDAAAHHDRLTGADAWREDDAHPALDAVAMRSAIRTLAALIERGDPEALQTALTESLYRHQSELQEPSLYAVALAGTKRVVEDFLQACVDAMTWLATAQLPIPLDERRRRFELAWRVYGRTALMLSGGATLGFHHLGVCKALFELGLLPEVICGASTGAMIAAGVCTRDDAELADMYANTDQIRLDGLAPVGLARLRETGAWLDPARLHAVLRHNIGDRTFAEARAHSGRDLNISVSPARARQKPRLLSAASAPDVLVASAALASSALPGLFPPAVLEMRDRAGRVRPYIDGERWVDGSLHGDLPKQRLARLHNANHFIVSQTNPHVLPFLVPRAVGRSTAARATVGVFGAASGLVRATARTQATWAADVARRATRGAPGAVQLAAEQLHNLASQDYRGDIDLHPRFHPGLVTKVVANPTRADLAQFILEGERAVWPHVPRIDAATRIGRAFRACVLALAGPERVTPQGDGVAATSPG